MARKKVSTESKSSENKKKTKTHAEIKIKPSDIVQAFKHSKKYMEDYRIYEKEREVNDWLSGDAQMYAIRLSKAGKKLCKKYNILYPINPFTPAEERETTFIHTPITFLNPPALWNKSQMGRNFFDNAKDQEVITHVNGKLVLMIDTDYPRDQIKTVFKEFLKRYTEEPGKRLRDDNIDIWKVYKAKEFENKNLLQITREENNVKGNPNYDGKVDAYYRQVKRAYRKASQIIKVVIPSSAKN